MTNPTPEQMLELAKICEPDKNWTLCNFKRDVFSVNSLGNVGFYDPLNNEAQLMEVVFALANIGVAFILESNILNKHKASQGMIDGSATTAEASTPQQAILNLAVEVLL
jgi:hypothetical protein